MATYTATEVNGEVCSWSCGGSTLTATRSTGKAEDNTADNSGNIGFFYLPLR